MSAAYVRRYYRVDFKRFDRLAHDNGRSGVVVSFPDQYVGVRFDGDRHTSRCHALELHHETTPEASDRG